MMLRKWDNDAGQAQSVGYRSLVGHDCFFLRKSIYKKKKKSKLSYFLILATATVKILVKSCSFFLCT